MYPTGASVGITQLCSNSKGVDFVRMTRAFGTYLGITDESPCASGADHIIRQNLNGPILKNGDQADAIFYFSVGQHHTNVPVAGDGSSLRSVEGFDPNNETLIENGTYPLGYFLQNTYCASHTGAAPCPRPAGARVKQYIGEAGWICKADATTTKHFGKHGKNPWTGVNYRQEIENAIRADGFAPLTYGPTGGSTPGSSFCREFDH